MLVPLSHLSLVAGRSLWYLQEDVVSRSSLVRINSNGHSLLLLGSSFKQTENKSLQFLSEMTMSLY